MLFKLCNTHPLGITRFAKVWIYSRFCSLPLFSMPMTQDILRGLKRRNECKPIACKIKQRRTTLPDSNICFLGVWINSYNPNYVIGHNSSNILKYTNICKEHIFNFHSKFSCGLYGNEICCLFSLRSDI